jgi:hypothetical protein
VIKLNANIGDHFTDVNGGAATLSPAPNNRRYNPATDDRLEITAKTGSATTSMVVSPGSTGGITGPEKLVSRFQNGVEIALMESRPGWGNGQHVSNGSSANQGQAIPAVSGGKSDNWVNVFLNRRRNESGATISSVGHVQIEDSDNIVDALFSGYVVNRVVDIA